MQDLVIRGRAGNTIPLGEYPAGHVEQLHARLDAIAHELIVVADVRAGHAWVRSTCSCGWPSRVVYERTATTSLVALDERLAAHHAEHVASFGAAA